MAVSWYGIRWRAWLLQVSLVVSAIAGTSCTTPFPAEEAHVVTLYQAWELQPGEQIAGYTVAGSLGDIAIEMEGHAAFAPFNGKVQPYANAPQDCVVFLSNEVPAYLFRLCGLKHPRYGFRQAGAAIGRAEQLQFATLRQQPDGTWALVEPSSEILERVLKRPSPNQEREKTGVP
ncbi:MAG: hypothetical protein VKK04_07125 [Synechococcales bacterium]|nr:hypothetical protein [Synechococcales bacterium]